MHTTYAGQVGVSTLPILIDTMLGCRPIGVEMIPTEIVTLKGPTVLLSVLSASCFYPFGHLSDFMSFEMFSDTQSGLHVPSQSL